MSRQFYSTKEKRSEYCYDYEHQVWIKDGKYESCNHPSSMNCSCFGRIHAGEAATITEACK